MLIHLKGHVNDDVIEFDLPQIYFKRGQTISVAYIEIDWRIGHKRMFHGEIISTLVDKSPCNPKQQIYRIHKEAGSNYTCDTPTHFLHYKIQCLDLKSSVFKINVYGQDENKIFKSVRGIYLILFIADAGFQCSTQRKTN